MKHCLEKALQVVHRRRVSEIILYPTETVYGLGVHAFDAEAWRDLCVLKGRSEAQRASWLVRDMSDIERLAVVTPAARELAKQYLPGPLTLVLQAKDTVPTHCVAADGTVSFRISSDGVAAALIADYMERSGGVPLTCTSANVHGLPPQTTPTEILLQFGDRATMITQVIDGGKRSGQASTVVRCVGEDVSILRQGVIAV